MKRAPPGGTAGLPPRVPAGSQGGPHSPSKEPGRDSCITHRIIGPSTPAAVDEIATPAPVSCLLPLSVRVRLLRHAREPWKAA